MSLKKEDLAENHQRGHRVPLKVSNKDTVYSKPCDGETNPAPCEWWKREGLQKGRTVR